MAGINKPRTLPSQLSRHQQKGLYNRRLVRRLFLGGWRPNYGDKKHPTILDVVVAYGVKGLSLALMEISLPPTRVCQF